MNTEINYLDLQLTELEDRFDAKTKEPGTTAEELREINREHTRLLGRYSALLHGKRR
ncbi:MAG TPA: hypothetical protein VGK21_01425 [Candidatus Angelobacter sp.]|jgi:hypothetical protein